MIALGPYELLQPAGRGGTAVVWRAVHRAHGVPVAVKVLCASGARQALFASLFAWEARTAARLHHPGIARVLDQGSVPEELGSAHEGLVAGSPFIVMEWVGGGELRKRLPLRSWAELRELLGQLLAALAHAHAREVVHRDLKPENVLLAAATPDDAPVYKLVDFGIARALGELRERGAERAGTPGYMAPEQLGGDWRDLGPWTDLWSLGCLAFAAATGTIPFGDPAARERAGLGAWDAPPLAPRFAVPAGFDAWLGRLLAAEPGRRYHRAADAAWALGELARAAGPLEPGPVPSCSVSVAPAAETGVATEIARPAWAPELGRGTTVSDTPAPAPATGGASGDEPPACPSSRRPAPATARPPLETSWRDGAPPQAVERLPEAGLALLGLRSIALVGREPERDLLWRALAGVEESGRARLVCLHGATGAGKSRLAAWLAYLAHERGAATWLRGVHQPQGGPSHGLGPMLARHLRVEGLGRSAAFARIAASVPGLALGTHDAWIAFAEELAMAADPDGPTAPRRIRARSPVERHAIHRAVLGRLAQDRPLVLWLDDVHWAADSLELVEHLLDAQEHAPCPVLVLATLSDDELASRPEESALIARLLARTDAEPLEVAPLPADEHAVLVRELLGLDGEIAAAVEARTAGNPLFAVQLVGDWLHRGLLVPARRGLRLAHDGEATLPRDLGAVWEARVERVLEAHPGSDHGALELAALLGRVVDGQEWRAACTLAGCSVPHALLDDLLRERLLRTTDERGPDAGFSFVHTMLCEALERHAARHGRAAALHRACAAMLAGSRGPGASERLGRHLLAAGEPAGALAPLLVGAREAEDAGDLRRAALLLDEHDRACDAASIPATDEQRGAAWPLRLDVLLREGRMADAETVAQEGEELARAHGWTTTLIRALPRVVRIVADRGDRAWALTLAAEGERLARARGEVESLAEIALAVGDLRWRRGELDQALASYLEARDRYAEIDLTYGIARSHVGLGKVWRSRGSSEPAIAELERARELFARCGSRLGMAKCINILGDAERDRGALERAQEHYIAALRILDLLGSAEARFVEVNLAAVALERGRVLDARTYFQRARRGAARRGMRTLLGCAEAGLVACEALEGRWEAFDRVRLEAARHLAEHAFVDPDVAGFLERAGEAAARAGEVERARAVLEAALAQWRALGRDEAVARVEALLGS